MIDYSAQIFQKYLKIKISRLIKFLITLEVF